MDGIFNLFLNNPLILFIVIAVLLSLFRGSGGAQQEQKRPQQRRQPQQSGQQRQPSQSGERSNEDQVDWKDIFKQEQPPTERQPTVRRTPKSEQNEVPENVQAELSKANEGLQEQYEKVRERKRRARESAGKIQDSPIARGDVTKSSGSDVQLDFSKITREDAIKGIVWSEILGKPKARR